MAPGLPGAVIAGQRALTLESTVQQLRGEVQRLQTALTEAERDLALTRRQLASQTERRRALDSSAKSMALQLSRAHSDLAQLRIKEAEADERAHTETELHDLLSRAALELNIVGKELQSEEQASSSARDLTRACHAALLAARADYERCHAEATANEIMSKMHATHLQQMFTADLNALTRQLREDARSRIAMQSLTAERASHSPNTAKCAQAVGPSGYQALRFRSRPQKRLVENTILDSSKIEAIRERHASQGMRSPNVQAAEVPSNSQMPSNAGDGRKAWAIYRAWDDLRRWHLAATLNQWWHIVSTMTLIQWRTDHDKQLTSLRALLKSSQAALAEHERTEDARRSASEFEAKRSREMKLQLNVLQQRLRLAASPRNSVSAEKPPWRGPMDTDAMRTSWRGAKDTDAMRTPKSGVATVHGSHGKSTPSSSGGFPACAGLDNRCSPIPTHCTTLASSEVIASPSTSNIRLEAYDDGTMDSKARILAPARATVAQILAESEPIDV